MARQTGDGNENRETREYRSYERDRKTIRNAQGKRPYPCRYVITSKLIAGAPQYSIQIGDWKSGNKVAAADFGFKNSTKASKVDLKELKDTDALPPNSSIGASK